MAAMPIYGKIFKNLLLQNRESFEAESWYIASGTQVLLSFFFQMMVIGRPLTFLRQCQICAPIHLSGENVEKSFSQ